MKKFLPIKCVLFLDCTHKKMVYVNSEKRAAPATNFLNRIGRRIFKFGGNCIRTIAKKWITTFFTIEK
jgi:hypothetical protein